MANNMKRLADFSTGIEGADNEAHETSEGPRQIKHADG